MPKLRRNVTFLEALAINISAIIGAGIFTISGLAAGLAGPGVIFSIAIGAIIAIFTGMSFAELAHVYAREGGNYEYSREVLGSYAGFIAGFVWIAATIISGAAVALSFGGYFLSIFNIPLSSEVMAALLIIVLAVINYFGVKHSARISVLLIIVNISILALFVIIGIFFVKTSNFVPLLPKGLGGVAVSSAFIFFAYTGFARVTMLGEEIEKPKKTIPKAIIVSIAISALVYTLVMFVLIGIIPYQNISSSTAPLANAMYYATHNKIIDYAISLGAIVATVNVDLAMILGLSRVVFAMSRDHDLPKVFNRINKYGVPDAAIAIPSLIMVLAMFAISFKEIVALSNSAALVSYAIANLGAIKLAFMYRKDRNRMLFGSKYFIAIPALGLILTSMLLIFLTRLSIILTFAMLVFITIYYILAKAERTRLGLPLTQYKHIAKKPNW
ncbi:MAG: APC family permease [Candidatus Micrarchaeia archaeon]